MGGGGMGGRMGGLSPGSEPSEGEGSPGGDDDEGGHSMYAEGMYDPAEYDDLQVRARAWSRVALTTSHLSPPTPTTTPSRR